VVFIPLAAAEDSEMPVGVGPDVTRDGPPCLDAEIVAHIPTDTTANREIDIDGVKKRIVTSASTPTAIGAGIETRGATP
jgi:hypothetical protein